MARSALKIERDSSRLLVVIIIGRDLSSARTLVAVVAPEVRGIDSARIRQRTSVWNL